MNKFHIITAVLSLGLMSFTMPLSDLPKSRLAEERLVDYHANGVQRVAANIKKNKLSGTWKSWFISGSVCDSGRFVGNVPDGEWKSWYPNGKTRVVWHFNARKLAGVKDELLKQPKNRMYVIAQKPVTEAVQYYRVEYWYGEQKTSPVSLRSQLVSAPAFTREELLKRVDDNTVHAIEKYRPPFTEALLHGNYTSYYPDGSLREDGVYINGMREGAWEEYATDGTRSRGSYRHNEKEGEWRTYDKKGKLLHFKRFNSRGEIVEQHEF